MFLTTSVTTLRERESGTLERLLSMPIGKADFVLGYALAFGGLAVTAGARWSPGCRWGCSVWTSWRRLGP